MASCPDGLHTIDGEIMPCSLGNLADFSHRIDDGNLVVGHTWGDKIVSRKSLTHVFRVVDAGHRAEPEIGDFVAVTFRGAYRLSSTALCSMGLGDEVIALSRYISAPQQRRHLINNCRIRPHRWYINKE